MELRTVQRGNKTHEFLATAETLLAHVPDLAGRKSVAEARRGFDTIPGNGRAGGGAENWNLELEPCRLLCSLWRGNGEVISGNPQ